MAKYIYIPMLALEFVFNTENHKRIYHYLNTETKKLIRIEFIAYK